MASLEPLQVQVIDFFDGKIVDVDGNGQTQQSKEDVRAFYPGKIAEEMFLK